MKAEPDSARMNLLGKARVALPSKTPGGHNFGSFTVRFRERSALYCHESDGYAPPAPPRGTRALRLFTRPRGDHGVSRHDGSVAGRTRVDAGPGLAPIWPPLFPAGVSGLRGMRVPADSGGKFQSNEKPAAGA